MTIEDSTELPALDIPPSRVPGAVTSPNTADGSDKPAAKDVAIAAKEQTTALAHSATDASKVVAQEAGDQVSAVAGQAKEQISAVIGQAKDELKTQVDARSQQAAAGLQTLSDQLSALANGRPNEAGHVGTLVNDAQFRVQSYAQTLQDRGPQALVDDLATFARRRPVRFLFGVAVAGFAAGRLARSGAAAAKDDHEMSSSSTSSLGSSTSSLGSSTSSFGSPADRAFGDLASEAR